MSKAILVMDMPERCSECNFSNPDGDWCPFHGEVSYPEYGSKKPDDCPLKPIPKKYDGWFLSDRTRGWNACIDKI